MHNNLSYVKVSCQVVWGLSMSSFLDESSCSQSKELRNGSHTSLRESLESAGAFRKQPKTVCTKLRCCLFLLFLETIFCLRACFAGQVDNARRCLIIWAGICNIRLGPSCWWLWTRSERITLKRYYGIHWKGFSKVYPALIPCSQFVVAWRHQYWVGGYCTLSEKSTSRRDGIELREGPVECNLWIWLALFPSRLADGLARPWPLAPSCKLSTEWLILCMIIQQQYFWSISGMRKGAKPWIVGKAMAYLEALVHIEQALSSTLIGHNIDIGSAVCAANSILGSGASMSVQPARSGRWIWLWQACFGCSLHRVYTSWMKLTSVHTMV